MVGGQRIVGTHQQEGLWSKAVTARSWEILGVGIYSLLTPGAQPRAWHTVGALCLFTV